MRASAAYTPRRPAAFPPPPRPRPPAAKLEAHERRPHTPAVDARVVHVPRLPRLVEARVGTKDPADAVRCERMMRRERPALSEADILGPRDRRPPSRIAPTSGGGRIKGARMLVSAIGFDTDYLGQIGGLRC